MKTIYYYLILILRGYLFNMFVNFGVLDNVGKLTHLIINHIIPTYLLEARNVVVHCNTIVILELQ